MHIFALVLQYARTIGDVVFLLLILIVELVECVKQFMAVKHVCAHVDFRDLFLTVAGVLFFDDSLKFAVGVANNAPQSRRIVTV